MSEASTEAAVVAGSNAMGTVPASLRSRDVARRHQAVQLGVWCFLATVTMLFAAFSSSYIVRQAGTDWQQTPLPGLLWVSTLVLALSSVALEMARREARRERLTAVKVSLATTILLGLTFLAGQFAAWRQMVAEGYYLPTNPHSAFFYILTGLHAAHLGVGLLVLAYVGGRVSLAGWRNDRQEMPFLLSMGATFWHFFGALWVYLFLMLTFF